MSAENAEWYLLHILCCGHGRLAKFPTMAAVIRKVSSVGTRMRGQVEKKVVQQGEGRHRRSLRGDCSDAVGDYTQTKWRSGKGASSDSRKFEPSRSHAFDGEHFSESVHHGSRY